MSDRRRFLKEAAMLGGAALLHGAPASAAGTPAEPAQELPAWLRGKPLLQWIQIPSTRQTDSADVLHDLVAAGYTNRSWGDVGWGESPRNGTFAFSGGALRIADSLLLSFGGGGATWAGNEVRALRLSDDAPRWFCAVKPAKVSGVWPKAARNSSAYNPDGSPISRHSYWQPQFNNARDEFMAFGAQNVWSADKGTYYNVDAVPLGSGVWRPHGYYGDQHPFPRWDGAWICKHPVTEDVYCATSHYIQPWDAKTGRWGGVTIDTSWVDLDRGCAAVDPVRNRIFRIGPKSGRGADAPGYIDIALRSYLDV
ncbi:MAG: hypothetical protein ABI624_04445, partial [Casimicrobiaceae bacterium]